MKAVVYKGPHEVAVDKINDPAIEQPTDAIVRITSTAICGSDLHMYEGRTAAKPGMVFGHEPMGIVEDVGDAVASIREGDRVVMPFNISCGTCFNCIRGFYSSCLTMNPEQAGAAFGYVGMGPYKGGQAEFLRVPFADVNCLKLPGKPGDEYEDDFLMLADIFPTGYYATELAMVQPGGTVAVFGDGPVGLLSAYSAILKGASEVYVVGAVHDRLQKAEQIGAIPIDMTKGDPVQQIFDIRSNNRLLMQSLRPGEEKMMGVMHGIDAVGYEATDWEHKSAEHPSRVLQDLIRLVNPTGFIGVIGVYLSSDPGGVSEDAKQGQFPIWFGKLWEKGLTIRTGQTPVNQFNRQLRDLIISGRAKPSFIVGKHMSLDDAAGAYEQFGKRAPGFSKVILKPEFAASI